MSETYERMMKMLPVRYWEDDSTQNIERAGALKIDELNAVANDVYAQSSPSTATWGIANWEKILGIPVDETKPLQERRERVLAKIRFSETVTKETIRKVVSAWFGEEISVVERFADYEVMIEFLFDKAIGKNFVDVVDTLRELLPAHLEFGFAPSLKESVEIQEKATVNMRRYHRIGEFRIGMSFTKYQNEVELT
ncbi:putative phage tail protein [Aneurinibacillus migulanus]|uniref:Phage portal protein n=2 Tax=Aneurinibacillus migulanus TaxID=47500 RepID=A0A1G8NW86_ANEMI|nr:putative phage tail protein [Aneurinibacillus migulanus]MED0893841.1 DUF2313 domain-containing protein [Aneurinibacillus migulanus]MED1614520.1 DUF2313 domain-containing protein [Aneurinibacillus migulanus]SDI84435.1 hypothetical protein SAMN04487909_108142 [Aneurinibacillus migulanus]